MKERNLLQEFLQLYRQIMDEKEEVVKK